MLLTQDIRPLARSSQQRLVSIAIVIGLHVTALAAILMALNHTLTVPVVPDLTLRPIEQSRAHPSLPPPPPVVLAQPRTAEIPPPVISTSQQDASHTIAEVGLVTTPAPVNPSTYFIAAQAIIGTHTTPDYPPFDARMGHEGNVMLKLAIDERGVVVDAQIERSSGYESLDQAAANWVKGHWRYHPATRAGDAIPSSAEVTVTFRLTAH